MEFETWEPVYEAILADFGYDREADRRSRDRLRDIVPEAAVVDPASLSFDGSVAVVGGGAMDARDARAAREATHVLAASDGATGLRDRGIAVDFMVTDLDGDPATAPALAAESTPIAVHAHGDNIETVRTRLPNILEAAPAGEAVILPTTQAEPLDPPYNFGGFTDGDRAAFIADALGAQSLAFPGWDFDDPTVDAEKRRKLEWARRLLRWLELRRDEPFALLDGRRRDVDLDDRFAVDS